MCLYIRKRSLCQSFKCVNIFIFIGQLSKKLLPFRIQVATPSELQALFLTESIIEVVSSQQLDNDARSDCWQRTEAEAWQDKIIFSFTLFIPLHIPNVFENSVAVTVCPSQVICSLHLLICTFII